MRDEEPFKPLTDLDPMPFGKYGPRPKGEGKLMQDVPARYLHWLWTESNLKEETEINAVADYIKRNLSVLESEYTNGIWR